MSYLQSGSREQEVGLASPLKGSKALETASALGPMVQTRESKGSSSHLCHPLGVPDLQYTE